MLRAYMERDSILIGDVAALVIEVEQDATHVVAFPEYDMSSSAALSPDGDALLESAGAATLDTLSREGRRLKLRRKYLFRGFEPGRYNLGTASVLYADMADQSVVDTLWSNDSLIVNISTFLIDSTAHAIFDVKAQRELPFKYGEISGYVKWILIIVALTLLVALAVLKIMSRYGYSTFGIFDVPPPIPPHITAFKALESLRGEKLWQEGEYKRYYSALTDILRGYISGRFGVAALEMTSDEIVAALRDIEDVPQRCKLDVQELLRDADLVKFAKAEFDATRNEGYFVATRSFIEHTMEQDEEELEQEKEQEKEKEIAEVEVSEQGEEVSDEK